MTKKEMLKIIGKSGMSHLNKLFRSEAIVDELIAMDTRLQEMFIQRLPDKITAQDIIKHWGNDWKKLKSEGYVKILKEVSYQEFKKIKNPQELIKYWYSTTSQHLRAVIRRIILELLPKLRPKLSVELVRDLYFIIFNYNPND